MKKMCFLSFFVALFINLNAQNIDLLEVTPWLESACLKWSPVTGTESYEVSYSGEGISNRKIDSQLIRNYGSYYRADVLGLKAGVYTFVVKALDAEKTVLAQETTTTYTVLAHDRSGFAHATTSPGGTASGAYNDDGTLKSDAVVIYVTSKNAADVDIYTNVLKPREKKDNALVPTVIRFIGHIKEVDMPGINSAGLLQLKGNNNSYNQKVTFEGVGDDALLEFGFDIVRCCNVEIRNLGFKNFPEDGISIQSNNTNIWIHNNDLFYGQNKGGDKKKGDGATDIKDSQWCTVSYNHYWDSGKANLFGNGDDAIDYISYHHNYLDHSDSRHPRVRCAQRIHVYNNYFCGVGKYGIGAARKSSIFVENNYFENTKNPMLSSKQGTDILDGDGSGTFSGEDGGIIKAFNNTMVGLRGNYRVWEATGVQNVDFDAYEVTNRSDLVPESVVGKQGGATYSNFDQQLNYSEFRLDTPEDAKQKVQTYAGRFQGGDLKIIFGATDYLKTDDPDAAIVSLLSNYASSLVLGDDSGTDPEDPEDPGNPDLEEGDEIHNFTTQGKSSSFYSITGNLSTSKGTVTYGELTLTQCLKVESSTNITFTASSTATLTLVLLNNSKTLKIDGNTVEADENGIVTIDLSAGVHTITRGSGEAYIYFMSLVYKTSTSAQDIDFIKWTLYPNPVSTILTINTDAIIQQVKVLTIEGRCVKQFEGNIRQVDMSGMPDGSYLIKVKTSGSEKSGMVIKKS